MASAAVAKAKPTETFVDNKRKDDIRMANIAVAQAVADTVRTSLGPKGMDKLISTASGEVIITNDCATILNKMEVLQPAAKFLIELSVASFFWYQRRHHKKSSNRSLPP